LSFLHRNTESVFKPPLGGLGVVQKGEIGTKGKRKKRQKTEDGMEDPTGESGENDKREQ